MPLSEPRIIFGIHQITPYQRASGLPYGTLLVIGGGTLGFSLEQEELTGGSQRFPWAVENKTATSEFTASVKSLPNFLFELFLGATVTTTAAASGGTIDALVALAGTIIDGTGIASVAISDAAEIKTGKYIIRAVGPTTVDVYAYNSADFDRGTDLDFENDDLKITASALTISTAGTVVIPNLGVEITGGAGTIGMTTDDTASFTVTKPHGGRAVIEIGKSAAVFPEHGEYMVAEKRSTGEIFEVDAHKAVGSGFPLPLAEKAFAIQEMSVKLLYDSTLNKVATITAQTKES